MSIVFKIAAILTFMCVILVILIRILSTNLSLQDTIRFSLGKETSDKKFNLLCHSVAYYLCFTGVFDIIAVIVWIISL